MSRVNKKDDEPTDLMTDDQLLADMRATEADALIEDDTRALEWARKPIPPNKGRPAAQQRDAIKRARQQTFLKVFEETGNRSTALNVAGINANTFRTWMSSPTEYSFREQLTDAAERYKDKIGGLIHTLVFEGEEVPIIGRTTIKKDGETIIKDEIIGTKRVRDKILLMFHAKKWDHAYRDKLEIKADDSTKAQIVAATPFSRLTDRLNSIEERAVIQIKPEQLQIVENSDTCPSNEDDPAQQ